MPHELHVAKTFLLMATGLGSTWVGKASPFCLAWFVNSAVDTMASIEDMFAALCGYLPLLMTNCVTKEGFHGLSS